jgi:hypothetical protein
MRPIKLRGSVPCYVSQAVWIAYFVAGPTIFQPERIRFPVIFCFFREEANVDGGKETLSVLDLYTPLF